MISSSSVGRNMQTLNDEPSLPQLPPAAADASPSPALPVAFPASPPEAPPPPMPPAPPPSPLHPPGGPPLLPPLFPLPLEEQLLGHVTASLDGSVSNGFVSVEVDKDSRLATITITETPSVTAESLMDLVCTPAFLGPLYSRLDSIANSDRCAESPRLVREVVQAPYPPPSLPNPLSPVPTEEDGLNLLTDVRSGGLFWVVTGSTVLVSLIAMVMIARCYCKRKREAPRGRRLSAVDPMSGGARPSARPAQRPKQKSYKEYFPSCANGSGDAPARASNVTRRSSFRTGDTMPPGQPHCMPMGAPKSARRLSSAGRKVAVLPAHAPPGAYSATEHELAPGSFGGRPAGGRLSFRKAPEQRPQGRNERRFSYGQHHTGVSGFAPGEASRQNAATSGGSSNSSGTYAKAILHRGKSSSALNTEATSPRGSAMRVLMGKEAAPRVAFRRDSRGGHTSNGTHDGAARTYPRSAKERATQRPEAVFAPPLAAKSAKLPRSPRTADEVRVQAAEKKLCTSYL